jgi:ABC-type multidrug transport system fused ATPase/permease subunit
MVTGRSDHFQDMFSSNARLLSHLNRKFTTLLGVPRLYLELLSVTGLAALVLSMLALGRSSESLLPLLALFAGGAFRLMPAVNRITFAFQSLRMGRPIISVLEEDISHVTLEKTELEHKRNLLFENMIRVENVSYSYQNHLGNVIEGVNLEIKKGSEVGIIGTTGAGKSTFIDILLGLLKPTIGKVTVDGVDISTDIRGWQNLIGYVPQTVFLIDTSIKANIAFGIREDEIDNAKVTRALELAQLNEFVDGLPNGVDELVGERGVRLSGGQRQRIAIARALYLDPPILVFDEATSALDIDTEKEVMKSISHLKTFKTIVIVTHRLSALDECDQLIKIENRSLSIL